MASFNDLLNSVANHGTVCFKGEDEVALLGMADETGEGTEVELGNAVDLADLTQGGEKVVSSDGGLALEPCEPESLSLGRVQV